MRSNLRVVSGLLGAMALVVVLFVVIKATSDSGDAAGPTPTTETDASAPAAGGTKPEGGGASPSADPATEPVASIRFEAGEVVGGVQQLEFTTADEIRFKVHSDIADEVHFHGYDISQEVSAGGSTTFEVPATIEGVFEVELENAVVPLAEITVSPE